jgi:CheY-like chemotaxis protein
MKNCILIYDDDLDILSVCKIILSQYNYRVETRTRNTDIIADIDKLKPDLIFMDLWIPDMGGEKAVNLMKSNRATEHIPIILFSANSEIAKISKNSGADGFLRKPFEIISLLRAIKDLIPEKIES